MLKIITGGNQTPLDFDRYYILEAYDGRDSLGFTLPLEHPQYALLAEEVPVVDTETGQQYLVKAIDEGAKTVNVKAELDLDELRADLYLDYTNGSNTAAGTIGAVLPNGWSVQGHALLSIRRTVELEAATPLEIIEACASTYGVTCRYDNAARAVHIWQPEQIQPAGVYLTDELNLKEVNFKGSSRDFATRLYARGKDGLTFAALNDGKDYVDDHTYSDKVVSVYWKDERYTVAENLLADAKRNLAALAVPQRSYECSVLDLARAREDESGAETNIYAHLDLQIYTVCTLLDRRRNQRINHQVVQLKRWPNYPEENVVTLSTTAPKIQNTVKNIQTQIEKPISSFRQQMQATLDNLADTIAGYNGGNMVITENDAGRPNGLRIMDTEDAATAKKVLWLNLNGIAYSQNGAEGPYSTVWSFEQNGFVADWITTGTLNAAMIKVINLIADHVSSKSGSYAMDVWAAVLSLFDGEKMRSRLYTTGTTESVGILQTFGGNVTQDGLLDDTARVSYLHPTAVAIGEDKNGVLHGALRAKTISAKTVTVGTYNGSAMAYDGDIHGGDLYVQRFAPAGEALSAVGWKLINLASGGTAYALCQK